ncbi:MAG: hypothetical protein ACR2GH_13800 [Pseudonocardia sp.]
MTAGSGNPNAGAGRRGRCTLDGWRGVELGDSWSVLAKQLMELAERPRR